MIVRGAIVPHAPVLLAEVQPHLDEGRWLREATAELHLSDASAVVLVSPHGARAGVYRRPQGTLAGFGVPSIAATAPCDDRLAARLADTWGRPVLDSEADFGIVVPLCMGVSRDLPVVAVALPEVTGPQAGRLEDALTESRTLAAAILELSGRKDLAVVESALSCAGLSPRSPLTEIPGADLVHKRVEEAAGNDPASLEPLLNDLHEVGDACGIGPLAAVARVLAGMRSIGLNSHHPFGVGYLVAEFAP